MTSQLDLLDAVCAAARGVHGDVAVVAAAQVDRLAPLVTDADRRQLIEGAIARLAGLDALETHLGDPAVDEVMVNAGGDVWVDRDGVIERQPSLPPGVIDVVLERVLAPTGRRLDRTNPIVDVRLPDGARLCAVVPPISVDGTSVAIRRHRRRHVAVDDFVGHSSVTDLLHGIVASRCNVLVSGATSSGKTTFLASLLDLVDSGDRLVICEDTTELAPTRAQAVRLEARAGAPDGLPAVGLSTLVRAALRLRPDRLVVGEFRGPEVLAVIEAMNTGHDGSISTCHANSPVDALRRVETLIMQSAPTWPLKAIRRQVSRSVDVVVHLARDTRGRRQVVAVAEVDESDDEPSVRLLATFDAVVSVPTRSRRP
jgi:pilus assembly protein CpaF